MDLPGSDERLSIWKADLDKEGSFDEVVKGCEGVFHVATPMDFESKDPEVRIVFVFVFVFVVWIGIGDVVL